MGKIWHYALRVIVGLIYFINFSDYCYHPFVFQRRSVFHFHKKMLSFDLDGYSLKWYNDFFSSLNWQQAVKNSIIIAIFSTLLSTFFGTLAALGLSRSYLPFRSVLMAILISPMIVPLIISAAAMFCFIPSGLTRHLCGGYLGARRLGNAFCRYYRHRNLVGFDHSLVRAAHSLGASPTTTFFRIIVPLILPGVVSGALFAFITSFDEVVVIKFVVLINNIPFHGRCFPASVNISARPFSPLQPF